MDAIKLLSVDEGFFADGTMRLAAMEGETLVGCVDLYNYDPLNLRAEVGIVVQPQYRRQGVGCGILNALGHFCRHTLSLHQLYCDIAVVNVASLRLFEKCGFSRCGVMRDWVCNDNKTFGSTRPIDGYVDVVRMQLILSDCDDRNRKH